MIGRTISHYRIVEKLGEGGMGVVYKAEDTQLRRKVALKFLSSEALDDGESAARMIREAQAAAALDHANICHVYGIHEEEGRAFIAMAFIEGPSLAEKIKERPLPLDEALSIATQIAEGLQEAHEHGIVHRDVKPQNILLTTKGQVKILDFGLAALAGRSKLTKSGTTLGTPAYMAPEQLEGKEVDRRADVWALGCVLYEMLTQKTPFDAEYAQAIGYGILNEDPEPVTALRSGVPTEIDRIIAKALAKDSRKRYQYVDDFLVDLCDLKQSSESTDSASLSRSRQTLKNRSRRKVLFALAGGVLFGSATSLYYLLRPAQALSSMVILPLEMDADEEQTYLGEGLAEGLIFNLAQADDLRVISRDSAFRYQGESPDAREIGRELGVSAVLKGRISPRGGGLVVTAELVDAEDASILWSGRFQRDSASILNLDREIAASIADRFELTIAGGADFEPLQVATGNPEAHRLYLLGRYNWSRRGEYLLPSRDFFQQAIDLDPGYALGWAGLADAYLMLGGWSVLPPGDSYPRAKAAAERAIELAPSLAEPYATLGYYEMIYGRDWENGRRAFEQAISNNPNYATAHHWFAYYFVTVDDAARGVEELEKALRMDPLSPVINIEMARMLVDARRYEEAEAAARKAMNLLGLSGDTYGYSPLSMTYVLQGRRSDARAIVEKSLAGSGLPAFTWYNAGTIYALLGDESEARQSLYAVEALARESYVSPQMPAGIYALLGEHERALELFQAAIEDRSFIASWMRSPLFDGLWSDGRYAALMLEIGLQP